MRPVIVAAILIAATATGMAQPEPSGPHPRLFLDDSVRAAWKAAAKAPPIAIAIDKCNELTHGKDDVDRYMGFNWSGDVQVCLIAWAATGDDAHAQTAIKYFTALLDDVSTIGDKGGDGSVKRDHGYAIRMIGPTAALAYDWLHDHKLMTEPLRARARARFQAWTDWYEKDGYRAHSPSTNYHAGYLNAATLIAIAQAGEGGADSAALWKHVTGELWKGDMAKAFAQRPLAGGDWAEGWQYAPLSVAEYALSGRAIANAGVEVAGMREWLTALVQRHVYALSPRGQSFVGGDVDNETPNVDPEPMTLLAVLVGNATDDARSWAAAELARLGLKVPPEFLLYEALALARPATAREVPRKDWATWYLAAGTGNFYARTHWGTDGVWTVMQCTSTIDIDHFHPDAGNVVLSRGKDDVLVDPSPYGTLSTLTSNAPTVESAQLPDNYKPSQAYWSLHTGWDWAHQTRGGVIVGRCDYADQYKFQDRPSDVPAAMRDLVVVPWADGRDASLVVIDRANSGDKARGLHLRFRTTGALHLAGDVATTTVGDSALSIRRLVSSSGTPAIGTPTLKNCFDSPRGNCDAARIPVTDLRIVVDGPEMSAVHVIDATGKGDAAPAAKLEQGTGWKGVWIDHGATGAMVVYGTAGRPASLAYQAPAKPATHVVVDAPADSDGKATVTATAKDGGCAVTIAPGGSLNARPAVFTLDASCAVVDDPILVGASTLGGSTVGPGIRGHGPDITRPGGTGREPYGRRTGCCGAQSAPGSPLALGAVVLVALFGPRARRPRPRR